MRLKDIARLANVSISTVSLVLNNKAGVSREKRDYIRSLLQENGYTIPSADTSSVKRSFRFFKYSRHGSMVNGNPGFVNSILDAIEKECRYQNCNLIMTAFDHTHMDRIIKQIHHDPLDGIIMLGTEAETEDFEKVCSLAVPTVVVDCPAENIDISSVTMNNEEAIYAAVSYLKGLGHEAIGFLANALPSGNCRARLRAYKNALDVLDLRYSDMLVHELMPTMTGAYNSMRDLLERGTRFPSALVCNNDAIALGAMRALREFHVSVPEDISIIGFDDISFAAISEPPLTTVSVPCGEIGIWTVRLLINFANCSDAAVTKIKVSPHMVLRSSTAPYQPSDNPCLLRDT